MIGQFEAVGNDIEGLTQFLVAGDVELPPLSLGMDTVGPSQSPHIGVTFPNYLLPMIYSADEEDGDSDLGSDGDDPEWEARYADFAGQSDSGNFD